MIKYDYLYPRKRNMRRTNPIMIKERQSNIELLRIFAMLMIVAYHYIYHGIIHYYHEDAFIIWKEGDLLHRFFASALVYGGEVGVGIFFLITGYFQINRKKGTILKISLETIFYGCCWTVVFLALKLMGISFPYSNSIWLVKTGIQSLLTPLSSNTWWFITSYIILILFSPLINTFVNRLNLHGWIVLLIFTWVFLYTIDSFVGDYWSLERSVFFYLLGGFIKLYKKPIRSHNIYIYYSCNTHLAGSLWSGIC